jgi:hypothetical protein
MLAVIDGSKALRSAIEEFLGDQVAVARCQQHKAKNVKDYLPKEYHAEYERKMTAAWAMTEYDAARRALSGVVKELGRINIQAATSLEEGLEETLTLHRLGVPAAGLAGAPGDNKPHRVTLQSRPSCDEECEALASEHEPGCTVDCERPPASRATYAKDHRLQINVGLEISA